MSLRETSGGSPKKTAKGQELRAAETFLNPLLSSARVVVDNVIAGLKRVLFKEVFRLTNNGLSDRVMEIACGLHNLRVSCRHSLPTFDLLSFVRAG